MKETIKIALTHMGVALLIAGLCIPLIRRKIPMNRFYGFRLPQSFVSNEAWYAINEYGGKVLLLWMLPVFFVGLYGVFGENPYYPLISTGVMITSMVMAMLQSILKSRQIGKQK